MTRTLRSKTPRTDAAGLDSKAPSRPAEAAAPKAKFRKVIEAIQYKPPFRMNVHPHSRDGLYSRIAELEEAFRGVIQKLADMTADRDEWRRQHENLLAVRQQDLRRKEPNAAPPDSPIQYKRPLSPAELTGGNEPAAAAPITCISDYGDGK